MMHSMDGLCFRMLWDAKWNSFISIGNLSLPLIVVGGLRIAIIGVNLHASDHASDQILILFVSAILQCFPMEVPPLISSALQVSGDFFSFVLYRSFMI